MRNSGFIDRAHSITGVRVSGGNQASPRQEKSEWLDQRSHAVI